MLDTQSATATVAVKDLAAAQKFYEQTLGLRLEHTQGDQALTFATGSTKLLVYLSSFAGTNQATGVTWLITDGVDKLDSLVKELGSRGVKFEHYDLPGLTRQGDIHVGGGTHAAWFKDPDGNIHSLVSA